MATHVPSDHGPASDFAQAIVETLHEPLLILSPDLFVRSANDAFYNHFEVDQAETIGRKIYDLGNGQWNIPALRTLLEEVLPDNETFNDFLVEHRFEAIGHRIMRVNARRLDHAQFILLGIRDVTDQVKVQRELRASRQHLANIYASAKVGIGELTRDGRFLGVNDELCRIMGRSRAQLLGCTIAEVTHPEDLDACLQRVGRLFETGETFSLDKRYTRPDGSHIYTNSTASLLRGSDPPTMIVVTADLTDRRSAETAMRASEARLHALVSATSDVVFRMSADWTKLRRIEGEGYLEDAEEGHAWLERYIPDEEQPAILAAIERAKADRDVFELEHRVLRVDGSIGWMHSKAVPVKDEDGRVLEWFGAATDITHRKEAEEALRRSEAKMRLMTDSLPVLISYVDTEHRYGFNNRTYEQWFGVSAADMVGRHMRDVLGDKAYQSVRPMVEKALAGQTATFDARIEYAGAGLRDVHVVYVPDADESGAVRGMFALITDLTEHRRAEAAMRESEERYRALFNSIDEGFCVIEMGYDASGQPIDYTFLTVNPAFESQTGIKNAVGRSMRDIAPDNEQQWFEAYDEIVRTGESRRFQMPAEALGRYFDVYAFPVGEPAERRLGVLFRDIQEQREAEQALRISEQRYRLLVESAREYAMLMIDPRGVIVSWNVGAQRLFGYTAQEMVGQPSETLYTDEDRAAGTAASKRALALAEGLATTDQWYRRKDGSFFWANGVLRPLENGHPRGFVKILRDQTKQKAHEEQLKTLMAELNHRVKNTLAVVQSIASQTVRRAPDLATFRADFERRLSSIAKAHNLLTKTSWSGAALDRIIQSEMDAIAGAAARVRSKGPDVTLPPHMALALHMVLHELATNAHKYGCLSIADGTLTICWELEGEEHDQTLTLSWLEKCPAAITAPKAEGFGSRLIEQLIVYELKGTIERSFEEDGVHVCLRVPLRSRPDGLGLEDPIPAPDLKPLERADAHASAARPSILLVEDLAPLALAMKDELEQRGFTVIGPASSVAQARAMARATPPCVAILDVNLGDEQVYPLIPTLEAANIPMVLLTGHEPSSLPEAVRHIPVLPKPVELDDIERFIRDHCV